VQSRMSCSSSPMPPTEKRSLKSFAHDHVRFAIHHRKIGPRTDEPDEVAFSSTSIHLGAFAAARRRKRWIE